MPNKRQKQIFKENKGYRDALGVKVTARCPNTGIVTQISCRFCMTFEKESNFEMSKRKMKQSVMD